jgi:hypothetical protein
MVSENAASGDGWLLRRAPCSAQQSPGEATRGPAAGSDEGRKIGRAWLMGERLNGRYSLFQTRDTQRMIHLMEHRGRD